MVCSIARKRMMASFVSSFWKKKRWNCSLEKLKKLEKNVLIRSPSKFKFIIYFTIYKNCKSSGHNFKQLN